MPRSFCVAAAEALVVLSFALAGLAHAEEAPPPRPADTIPEAPQAGTTLAEPSVEEGAELTPPDAGVELGRLPIPAAERPLSLPAGIGSVHSGFTMRMSPLVMSVPFALALGVTDDLTIEARYTFVYEPEIRAIGRLYHDDVVEFGFRGLLRFPAVRNGDTVGALEANVLLHGWDVVRVQLGLGLDLVFSDPVSPLVYVPFELQISLARHFFIGARGWGGNDDGFWSGSLGPEIGFNVASATRPVVDIRVGVQLAVPSDGVTWMITHTFYPTIFE